MKRLLALLGILLIIPFPSMGAGRDVIGYTSTLLTAQSVTTAGGAVSVTVNNAGHSQGYLKVVTSAKVGTASLVVTANSGSITGLCKTGAITTETTYVLYIYTSLVTPVAPINTYCVFELASPTTFTFTVTGASGEFTISSSMVWLPRK